MTEDSQPLLKISPDDLLPLDDLQGAFPLRVDLVYARADHPQNIFGRAIYRPDARMLAHREIIPVIATAAEICHARSGYLFDIKDCLRTVEAQQAMIETDIVARNPRWLQEPDRMLSPPGRGGHPRGMAVDIVLIDQNGEMVDMGTGFDALPPDPSDNPAARNYPHTPPHVRVNRDILEGSIREAAQLHGVTIVPLPQEWWDFRFPSAYTNNFAPVSDAELPAHLRMTAL